MFHIKDQAFEIESARLYAEVRAPEIARDMWDASSNGMAWFLEIRAEERMIGEEDWQPWAFCHFNLPQAQWRDLEGHALENLSEEQCDFAVFSMDGHSWPFASKALKIVNRKADCFDIRWTGTCDLDWGEEYARDLDVLIEASPKFEGVTVYEHAGHKATEMLGEHFNSSDFTKAKDSGFIKQFKPELSLKDKYRNP